MEGQPVSKHSFSLLLFFFFSPPPFPSLVSACLSATFLSLHSNVGQTFAN